MVKTYVALCHGCDKKFVVEFLHEKAADNTNYNLSVASPILS